VQGHPLSGTLADENNCEIVDKALLPYSSPALTTPIPSSILVHVGVYWLVVATPVSVNTEM
jgi:hypothetical protein